MANKFMSLHGSKKLSLLCMFIGISGVSVAATGASMVVASHVKSNLNVVNPKVSDKTTTVNNTLSVQRSNVIASGPSVSTVKKLAINSSIIDNVDKDADNMNSLKRQLELEKIKADIKKVKTGSDTKISSLGDTVVTSVYVDETDQVHGKYATLQFNDGSTLDVEVGANVGGYKVSDIAMNGVTLFQPGCKKSQNNCTRFIKVGRLYSKVKNKNDDMAGKDKVIEPTSIINLHKEDISNGNDQIVPPIITKG